LAVFTRHPSSGVASDRRGTYAGVIEKIPYLQDLGIGAVELLPVFQFDVQDAPAGLVNYWDTLRFRSSLHTMPTARDETPWVPSTNFATWLKRCTGRALR